MKLKKRYLLGGLFGLTGAAVATKLLARPRDVELEESRDRVYHAEHSRLTEVNGLRVHYQETGDPAAPPMFLIHGFLSSTFVWSRVFLELAEAGYRVIAPDLIGYGYSAKPKTFSYSIAAQAEIIAGLIKKLGCENSILVGSSYGGAVASLVALDHPRLVSKLILVGAVSNNQPRRYLVMRMARTPILGDIVSPLLAGSRRLLRARMKRVYERHQMSLDEFRVEARFIPLRAAATHRAIIRTVRHWDAARIGDEAHLIKQPTLLVWGDNDPDVPLSDGLELQRRMSNSRLIVFKDCGHHPQEEYPDTFIGAVLKFCEDPSGSLA